MRVDRWLWSVRALKTRSAAGQSCRAGHVRVNDRPAKPATLVRVGDRVEVRTGSRRRLLEVREVIGTRVGAPRAAECFIDHSPARDPHDGVATPGRDRGAGRPTKRDRRRLDDLRGR